MTKKLTSALQFGGRKRYTQYPQADEALLRFLGSTKRRNFTAAHVCDQADLMLYAERSRVSHLLIDLANHGFLTMDTHAKYKLRHFTLTDKGKALVRMKTEAPPEGRQQQEIPLVEEPTLFDRLCKLERQVERLLDVVGGPGLGNKSWD